MSGLFLAATFSRRPS